MVRTFARRLTSSSTIFPPPSQPFTLLLVLDAVSGSGTTRYGFLTRLVLSLDLDLLIGRILLSLICCCYLSLSLLYALNLSIASMWSIPFIIVFLLGINSVIEGMIPLSPARSGKRIF